MLALKRLEADADRWMRRAALVVQKARTAKLDQHGKRRWRVPALVITYGVSLLFVHTDPSHLALGRPLAAGRLAANNRRLVRDSRRGGR